MELPQQAPRRGSSGRHYSNSLFPPKSYVSYTALASQHHRGNCRSYQIRRFGADVVLINSLSNVSRSADFVISLRRLLSISYWIVRDSEQWEGYTTRRQSRRYFCCFSHDSTKPYIKLSYKDTVQSDGFDWIQHRCFSHGFPADSCWQVATMGPDTVWIRISDGPFVDRSIRQGSRLTAASRPIESHNPPVSGRWTFSFGNKSNISRARSVCQLPHLQKKNVFSVVVSAPGA